MKRPVRPDFAAQFLPKPQRIAVAKTVAHFRALIERNKTRRRPGSPPAALPVVADSPRGGGLSGGALAEATNAPDARDWV